MNDDYLWDRTGEDPEIKRLEEALAGFRYKEIAPPVLPVTTAAAVTDTKVWWRFSLPLAFAAVTVVIVVAGVWFLIGGRVTGNMNDVALVDSPTANPSVSVTFPPLPEADPSNGFTKRAENPGPSGTQKLVSSKIRHRKVSVVAFKNKEIVLTPEEKDAYGRLLLALSITGSKLKIVTDTINRTDENMTVRNPNNR